MEQILKEIEDMAKGFNSDTKYEQVLIAAINDKKVDICKVIIGLDLAKNLNFTNDSGMTPLTLACNKGYTEIVTLLVDKGADLNVTNTGGQTPLFAASLEGFTKIVKILVDNGADLNLASKMKNTPLIIASQGGHTKIVKILVDKGADLNLVNEYNQTALQCASKQEIINILTNATTKTNTSETEQLLKEIEDMSKGFDPDTKYERVLIEAIESKKFDICKVIISLNLAKNLNFSNYRGMTPLLLASDKGHTEIVTLLVDKGADLNVANVASIARYSSL